MDAPFVGGLAVGGRQRRQLPPLLIIDCIVNALVEGRAMRAFNLGEFKLCHRSSQPAAD